MFLWIWIISMLDCLILCHRSLNFYWFFFQFVFCLFFSYWWIFIHLSLNSVILSSLSFCLLNLPSRYVTSDIVLFDMKIFSRFLKIFFIYPLRFIMTIIFLQVSEHIYNMLAMFLMINYIFGSSQDLSLLIVFLIEF